MIDEKGFPTLEKKNFLESAVSFFETLEPPQYREDAITVIPLFWDKKTEKGRREIFEDTFDLSLYKKNWDDVVKSIGAEYALTHCLYHLYGDDKNPLY